MRRFGDGLAIAAMTGVGLYGAALLALEPRDPANGVAVLFAPWTSAGDALSRAVAAGARFVRYGGYAFIVVVAPDDSGYPERVRAEGAVFIADPQILGGCLPQVGSGDVADDQAR